jgi:hypothetical protein
MCAYPISVPRSPPRELPVRRLPGHLGPPGMALICYRQGLARPWGSSQQQARWMKAYNQPPNVPTGTELGEEEKLELAPTPPDLLAGHESPQPEQ